MLKVSIFTASHNIKFLSEAYQSIIAQTREGEWEWIILLNNLSEADIMKVKITFINDQRVMVYVDEYEWPNKCFVGRLKSECCKRCTWDVLVELDHDDELTPECLEKTIIEFEKDPDVVFVYGNTVNINYPEITPVTWSSYFWWSNKPYMYRWKEVLESVSAAPFPQSCSRIWFAPNHVREIRKTAYDAIGWYDESMDISDDHNIFQRLYLHWKIKHVDFPSYIYKVHTDGTNTRKKNAQKIQTTMWSVHDKYFLPMMQKRCTQEQLKVVDLGWALNCPPGFLSVDRHHADVICDLNKRRKKLTSDSVWYIRAHHILEHLKDPIHVMNEAYRVLAHGWILEIEVPSDSPLLIDGKLFPAIGNKSDPTHITSRNSRSFRYYTEPQMRQYIEPEAKMMFTIVKPAQEFLKFDNVPVVAITLLAWKSPGENYYWANNRRK